MTKLKNNTFQNIELIKPRYFGICQSCNEVWLLHRANPQTKHDSKWYCHYCDNKLKIYKLKRKRFFTINDMKNQILNAIKKQRNSFGIFK